MKPAFFVKRCLSVLVIFSSFLMPGMSLAGGAVNSWSSELVLKGSFHGPLSMLSYTRALQGGRQDGGRRVDFQLPPVGVLTDFQVVGRDEEALGKKKNDSVYHSPFGEHAITVDVRAGKKISLKYKTQTIHSVDVNGWVTLPLPCSHVYTTNMAVELYIVEPREISEWKVPANVTVKELSAGEYSVTGFWQARLEDRDSWTLRWRVKSYSAFSQPAAGKALSADLFTFGPTFSIAQIAGVPQANELVNLSVICTKSPKTPLLGRVFYAKQSVPKERQSSSLEVTRTYPLPLSEKAVAGLQRNFSHFHHNVELFREMYQTGELSKASIRERARLVQSAPGVFTPLSRFCSDSSGRLEPSGLHFGVMLSRVLENEKRQTCFSLTGWEHCSSDDPRLKSVLIKEMERLRSVAQTKSSGGIMGWLRNEPTNHSKSDCVGHLRKLASFFEMVFMDYGGARGSYPGLVYLDQNDISEFKECVRLVDVFEPSSSESVYVPHVFLERNERSFSPKDYSDWIWNILEELGYICREDVTPAEQHAREFLILPECEGLTRKGEWDEWNLYCPIHDTFLSDCY